MERKVKIKVPELGTVSGILQIPEDAWCLMVLAHGAGAGMEHSFMEQTAKRLEDVGVCTLRFNFLYMENGGGRPDLPHVAHKVIYAAVAKAREFNDDRPVVGSGKSFGGRMISQAMAKENPPEIDGLVFYGFPLHAPGKPGDERAAHLKDVKVPMLFLQGTRDTLAQMDLISGVVKGLKKGTIIKFEGADHSFHVPKKSGKTDAEVMDEMTTEVVIWLRKKLG
jgi:predicted alpha/beta-hydrolase family hydrolase